MFPIVSFQSINAQTGKKDPGPVKHWLELSEI
jgi:hypothetical protein